MTPLQLSRNVVEIWYALTESINDPALLSAYRQLMSPDERLREKRFRFEKDRHTYVVTRALIRTVLSKYCSTAPDSWQFEQNHYGRPELLENRMRHQSVLISRIRSGWSHASSRLNAT